MKAIFLFTKKRWYIFLFVFVGVGVFIYNYQVSQAQVQKQNVHEVKRKTLRDTLSLSGEINADEHITLRFPVSGKLVWLGAKEGDRVKKYQGIASLDTREVQKNMQRSLNNYMKERYDFDQTGDDNQRVGDQPTREVGDAMKRLLEKAQYSLNNSVLDVEIQALAKEYSYLASPIEGILVRSDIKYPGVNTTPASAEFEIINPDTIYFSTTADQTDVIKLREGMQGQIVYDSYPDDTYRGEIIRIGYIPKKGETGTVYEVKVALRDVGNESKYKMGMTGDIEFEIGKKVNVVAIPTSYVKSENSKKIVWKLVSGNRVKSYIKTGFEIEGEYEILSGVQEGDIIVNTP